MPVLEQLFVTTEILATEQYPSLSYSIPLLETLVNMVLDATNDALFLATFKTIIKNGLACHFTLPGDVGLATNLLTLASFLI